MQFLRFLISGDIDQRTNEGGVCIKPSNFHTHCNYCDGKQEPETYVMEALQKGFQVLGFSCHTPLPFHGTQTSRDARIHDYIKAIEELKVLYKGRLEIYTGLEVDYYENDEYGLFNRYNLDYKIGSIHFIKDTKNNIYYEINSGDEGFEKTLHEYFGGNVELFVNTYYNLMLKMIAENKMDILGHLDVIKQSNKNNRYFSENEEWYIKCINMVLPEISKRGIIVEVNTGGIARGYIDEMFPSLWILRECKKLDIPIVLNSDAHTTKDIDFYFKEALLILKDVGYREVKILKNGKWDNEPIC